MGLQIKQLIILIGAFCALLALWTQSPLPLELKIVACDVGQGDAIVIKYGHKHILIDSGPNNDVLACLRQEVFWGNKTIDVAIITHWDEDHIGGFASVLSEYTVSNWLFNPSVAETKKAKELFSQIETNAYQPLAGDELVFPGMRVRVGWSELTRRASQDFSAGDQNTNSIALEILTESFGFFGTGDLECPEELAIESIGLLNMPQIIKVAHHGAKNGTCTELLQSLRPEVALISVGQGNSYGHPHTSVLQQVDNSGVFLKRTDKDGPITIEWSAQNEGFRLSGSR